MRLRIVAVLFVFAACRPALAADKLTQADLLHRLIDLDRLMTPPLAGERTGMFSSYDRASKLDAQGRPVDWNAGHDAGQFSGKDKDGWDLIGELKGPGALTRIWTDAPTGELRIVLDGEPAIEAPFADLFDGKLRPLDAPLCYRVNENGGCNCYFPIGFAKSCRILAKSCTSAYQVNYVTFAAGTAVETFSKKLDDAAQVALDEVATTFRDGLSDKTLYGGRKMMPVAGEQELKKGGKIEETIEKPGVIRGLFISMANRGGISEPRALHRCVLRIFTDGSAKPDVEVPLVDLFGSGFGLKLFTGLPVGTNRFIDVPTEQARESQFMYCLFPMPFAKSAKFEIENYGTTNIGLTYYLRVDTLAPAKDALYFKARYRREDPCKSKEFAVLDAAGRGRLVGLVLNVDCPRQAWWGEGDEKIWIDGERFPSYFGTGSADLLGDAKPLRLFELPLHGVTRSGPYGKQSGYRWLLGDSIAFQSSIHFTLENLSGDALDTYFGALAYWYGEPGAKNGYEKLTAADVSPPGLRIPGSVEIEGNLVNPGEGNEVKQKFADGAELSGETAVTLKSSEFVRIRIPTKKTGLMQLSLRVNPRSPFEAIEVADEAGQPLGTVKYDRTLKGLYPVGAITLKGGDTVVQVKCKGKATLDCWVIEAVSPRAGSQPAASQP